MTLASRSSAFSLALFQPGSGTPLAELLPRYFTAHPAIKPVSAKQLEVVINLAREFAGPEATCDEIFSLDAFEAWVKWLFDQPKCRGARPGCRRAPSTVRGKRSSLLTLWRFAHRRGMCQDPPPPNEDLAPIAVPKEDPVAWSPEQIAKIIHQCRQAPPIEWWQPAHWLALVWANWYTAERIEALLSCRRDDLQGDVLYVRACRTKDKKAGVHRLKPELCDLIRSLPMLAGNVPAEKRDLIWPWPYLLGALRGRYRRDILQPAGLPDDSSHLFHCIRRSSITEMVNVAGVAAAQELARHSSPSLTLDRYTSRRLLRTKTAADVLPDPTRSAERQKELF